MAKKRMIDTAFWSDSYVVDQLNPLDRYLFIYLFTNAHTTIAGVYELSLRIMSFETGITTNDLATMLKRLEPKVKYVDGYVILVNGIKNQSYQSPKIKTGILLALEPIKNEILQHIDWPSDFGNPKPTGTKQTQLLDTVSIPYQGVSHSNSNSNSKPEAEAEASKPQGFDKSKTLDRKVYARAVKADKELELKEQQARQRPVSDTTFNSVRDELVAKGIVKRKVKK